MIFVKAVFVGVFALLPLGLLLLLFSGGQAVGFRQGLHADYAIKCGVVEQPITWRQAWGLDPIPVQK